LSFIDFQNVWLAYDDALQRAGQFAVEAIDLRVRQGEFIAIVGPSGCGKYELFSALEKRTTAWAHRGSQAH
jgi:ABC-type nitrate/sulfonate/bicarbonate transport system ATPase subunit